MAASTGASREVKLLLDEMHAPGIAQILVKGGWDVVAVASEAPLGGLPDGDLFVHAATDGRVLVTENVMDFASLASEWAVKQRSHSGLIFTNPRRFNRAMLSYPGNLVVALQSFLEAPSVAGESWIWWL